MLFFCLFPSPSPLRRSKRAPRQIMKNHWVLQCFRRVGRFRAERTNKKNHEKPFEKNSLKIIKKEMQKTARNTFQNHPKIIKMSSKIDPGVLRSPLPSQFGAWSLPKRPKTHQNHAKRAPGAARSASWDHFSPKTEETWLSWNGKRERLKSVEHCRRKKRRKSIGKEERPEHEHREEQQGKRSKSSVSRKPARLYNRGGALARALRARARPVGVGIIS